MPKMMTCETDVKKEIKKLCQRYGCYYRPTVQTGYTPKGIPDGNACCRGWYLGIEAKYGNNGLSQHQSDDLKELAAAGGIALVINEKSLPVLEQVLMNITQGRYPNTWWFSLPQHQPGYLEPKK